MLSLKAEIRNIKDSNESIRKAGFIPAVFYGAGKKSTPVSVSNIDFKKIWHKAGESSTVTIETKEGKIDTLIHEIQMNPVTNEPIHVDFLAIDINKEIQVHVPIDFIGESPAVKTGLGTLVKVLHEVEIEALPKDLPHSVEVDISKLVDIESQVLVSDIKLPAKIKVITPMTDVVASIAVQKEEEEVTEPVDLSAIEVEKKGKKEEEGVGGEEESSKE